MRNACTEAVQRSVRGGLGSVIKKSDLITHEEEVLLLKSDGCALTNGRGCNNRMLYFLYRNMFIKGQNELRATNANQFALHSNSRGEEFLRYVIFYHFVFFVVLFFSNAYFFVISASFSMLTNCLEHV